MPPYTNLSGNWLHGAGELFCVQRIEVLAGSIDYRLFQIGDDDRFFNFSLLGYYINEPYCFKIHNFIT